MAWRNGLDGGGAEAYDDALQSPEDLTVTDTDTAENGGRTPPTISPVTFSNFVQSHRRTLPSRIDKSIMTNLAGGDQPKILGALRFFSLVEGPENKPAARFTRLRDAGDDEEAQKVVWAEMLSDAYAPAITGLDLGSATQAQIDERFREAFKISGDTVRKSVAFFLALARQADIPLSTYVKKTRQRTASSGPSKPRVPRPSRIKVERGVAERGNGSRPEEKPAGSSAMVVRFKSGGSATLYVNADWVNISTTDRDALLGWIDAMKDYAAKNPVTENQEPEASTSGS